MDMNTWYGPNLADITAAGHFPRLQPKQGKDCAPRRAAVRITQSIKANDIGHKSFPFIWLHTESTESESTLY